MKLICTISLLALVVVLSLRSQTFDCQTAFSHAHNDVREGQLQIVSWSGCVVSGTIGGVNVQLWADGASCPLRAKVPGTFNVRYDFTCKQVLDLSSGELPPYCPMPTPLPS